MVNIFFNFVTYNII